MREPVVHQCRSRLDWAVVAALLATTMAVYWPVRNFQWINYDDPQYVLLNPHVLGGLSAAHARWAFSTATFDYWQPLTWLSYQADVSAWGVRPGPMHVENAILHSVSAGLWYLLLVRMTGRKMPSLVVAAVFALHPTRVESVAWIAERKDVLSTALMLAALLGYVGYAANRGRSPARSWLGYAVACIAYALALMSKPMVVTFPLLLLILDRWPLCRVTAGKSAGAACPGVDRAPMASVSPGRALLEKIPFAVMAGIGVLLTLLSHGQAKAIPSLQVVTIADRLGTVTVGYVRYIQTLLIPARLSIYYPYVFHQPAAGCAAAGLLIILTWGVWRTRRRRPYLLFGWSWFVVCLLPVIGIVQSGSQSRADRFAYSALVGLMVAGCWFGADMIETARRRGGPRFRRAAPVVAAICCAAAVAGCAAATMMYLPTFHDGVTAFDNAARSAGDPDKTIESHLGSALIDAGRPDLALEHYATAVQLDPNDAGARLDLGFLLMRAEPAMALVQFQAAHRLKAGDPLIEFDLGQACVANHQPAAAAAAFRRALAIQPDFPGARAALEGLPKEAFDPPSDAGRP